MILSQETNDSIFPLSLYFPWNILKSVASWKLIALTYNSNAESSDDLHQFENFELREDVFSGSIESPWILSYLNHSFLIALCKWCYKTSNTNSPRPDILATKLSKTNDACACQTAQGQMQGEKTKKCFFEKMILVFYFFEILFAQSQ